MSDIRNIWQNQQREDNVITLTDIQDRSGKFRGRVRWRNVAFAAYSLLTLAVLARWLVKFSQMTVRSDYTQAMLPGVLMAVAIHAWILFALWWRGRARPLPDALAGEAALNFHRRELEHQARAAATAWAWYIMPFVPLFFYGVWLIGTQMPPDRVPMPKGPLISMVLVVDLLWFAALWLFFSRAATRIELELERLKRLRAE